MEKRVIAHGFVLNFPTEHGRAELLLANLAAEPPCVSGSLRYMGSSSKLSMDLVACERIRPHDHRRVEVRGQQRSRQVTTLRRSPPSPEHASGRTRGVPAGGADAARSVIDALVRAA